MFVTFQRLKGENKILYNRDRTVPPVSFYSHTIELANGRTLALETLKGRKVLLVNTASDCGYTAQYNELQKLYQHSREDLEIIAFPANDFKNQEKGSDRDIENFCSVNFGIRFPLAKKTSVINGSTQHPVFKWLSDKTLNGWNDRSPGWNFSKYLVNEEGVLTHYFAPPVSPLSEEMITAIHQE